MLRPPYRFDYASELMTFSTPHSASPGATAESKREELGGRVSSSTTIASSVESPQMSRPVCAANTQKQKDAKRFRTAIRKLWEHIRHNIPRITINITVNFPEANSVTDEPSDEEPPQEEPPYEWPPKGLPATMRGVIDISKRDPRSNRELPERSGIIVDQCSDINLISLELVRILGIADQIEVCEHIWIGGATQGMKAKVKGIVKIKFMFVEAVGIFPGYQRHYWASCYVPEDTKCNFDVSICGATAEKFEWHIPKHLGTGIRVQPPPPKPGGAQAQLDEYLKNKRDKDNLSLDQSPSPSLLNGSSNSSDSKAS